MLVDIGRLMKDIAYNKVESCVISLNYHEIQISLTSLYALGL